MTARIIVAYSLIALIVLGISAAIVWFRLNHPGRRTLRQRAAENQEYAALERAQQRKRFEPPQETSTLD
jgi:type II secretory pathway pseudopilin PulG